MVVQKKLIGNIFKNVLKKAQKLTEEAKELLETLDLNTEKLSSVADYLVKRNF